MRLSLGCDKLRDWLGPGLALYLSLVGVGSWLFTGSLGPLFVLAVSLLPLYPGLSSRLRRVLVVTSILYLGGLGSVFTLLAVPAIVLAPLLYAGVPERVGWSFARLPFGPPCLKLFSHLLVLGMASLVNPLFLIPVSLLALSCTALSLSEFVSLRDVGAELVHAPRFVVLGTRARIVVGVDGISGGGWAVVFAGGSYVFTRVGSDGGLVRVPIETGLTGRHNINLRVFVCGQRCLGRRLVLEGIYEYSVIPNLGVSGQETAGLLEALRGLAAGGDGGGVEVLTYRLSGGVLQNVSGFTEADVAGGGAVGTGGVGLQVLERMYAEALTVGSGHSRIGDYCGVRLYQPGDDARSIHWKKSVSLGELVVREYLAQGGPGGAGRIGRVIVTDLSSTSLSELGGIIGVLVDLVREVVLEKPFEGLVVILYAAGSLLVLRGPSVSVAEAVVGALREGLAPQSYYSYESSAAKPSLALIESVATLRGTPGPLGIVADAVVSYADGVARLVESNVRGYGRGAEVIVVHGRSTLLRNTLLELMLRKRGFRVLRLRALPSPEEQVLLADGLANREGSSARRGNPWLH